MSNANVNSVQYVDASRVDVGFLSRKDISILMISPETLASRLTSFPERYVDNFDYVWRPKIRTETNSSDHILDKDRREYFYCKFYIPRYNVPYFCESFKSLKQT